jgi:cysteine desulfurase/selenocysteine lyase
MATQVSKWDVDAVRKDFPLLHHKVNSYHLAYLDNAATTQKPKQVLNAMRHYYEYENSNVHRGVHTLSVKATQSYEDARATVARFIRAPKTKECIFVRGTTEGINLVANAYFLPRLNEGDEIILTHMEHHANIVPWQMIAEKTGAILKVVPISLNGELLLDHYAKLLGPKTKCVACTYASNALGTINPIKKIAEMAHLVGAKVVVDGAQATAHLPVDVQALGIDFYAFSGHKMYGPTGIGVLWGREDLLNAMQPYQGGGEMISSVSFDFTEYAPIPHKFEAGTPNIAGAIGLAAAIDYLGSFSWRSMIEYEAELLHYASEALLELKGFNIVGTASDKVPVISFVHGKIHPHDIGTILDTQGVAIRSGHHCAMPLMSFLDLPATARISLSFYNTFAEVDQCMKALVKVKEVFT